METLPAEIVFAGGGYIAMEFAHIAARCGSKVTVIHSGAQPLKHFDTYLVDQLISISEEIGIKFILNARVSKIEKLQKNLRIFYDQQGKEEDIIASMVFNTTGRVPSIGQLALEKGGIDYDEKKGVLVNEYLQSTSNPKVYACGDASASGNFPLTPTSNYEGDIASINIRKSNKVKINLSTVPSVIFTIPQIAKTGLSEKEAREKGMDYSVIQKNVPKWFNAKHKNEKVYAFKTIIDNKHDTILGAHVISPKAGEIINLFTMAIQAKLTIKNLKDMIFAYPTWGHDIKSML